MKKNIVFTIMLIFAANLSFFGFLCGKFLEYKNNAAIQASISNVKSAISVLLPHLSVAINDLDDIALINGVQSLTKIQSVSSSFILNNKGKTIISDGINQINKTEEEQIYQNALKKGAENLQKTETPFVYALSYPLRSGYFLFCIISNKEIQNQNNLKYYLAALAVAFFMSIILSFILNFLLFSPFGKSLNYIKGYISGGFLQAEKRGDRESGAAKSVLLHSFIAKARNLLSFDFKKENRNIYELFLTFQESKLKQLDLIENRDKTLFYALLRYFEAEADTVGAFIVLDSLNNIVFAFDKTKKVLKEDFKRGNNIVESILDIKALEFIGAFFQNCAVLEENINGLKIKFYPFAQGHIIIAKYKV
ncbi:MAG: hypothetical protein LBH29_04660 [Elusimicrobiota bacterium]|jgi:hypothetical protein|nr:hypothetical protein [Elusimicrobiota bacterium]